MSELSSCPFCGGELELFINESTIDVVPGWDGGATCQTCGIGIETGFYGCGMDLKDVENHIVDKINTRPSPWLPIESAPKDGTQFDLWCDGERHTDCWWEEPDNCFFGREGRILKPSHWMYSPAGPKE